MRDAGNNFRNPAYRGQAAEMVADGEVLKYRGKGGAHFPQWPVGAIPPVRSEHTMVASSFRGRADQAMRPATQLSQGAFVCVWGE